MAKQSILFLYKNKYTNNNRYNRTNNDMENLFSMQHFVFMRCQMQSGIYTRCNAERSSL